MVDEIYSNSRLKRNELWTQLSNATNLRSAEDQVLWSIFGTFWATNAILLIALFTSDPASKDESVSIIISFIGLVLSLIWFAVQNRALGHLMRYEELIKKIEIELNFNPNFALSAEINCTAYEKFLISDKKFLRARFLMKASSIGVAFSWTGALLFFYVKSF